MTTIACDGRQMSADGLITSGDTIIQTNYTKIFRLKDGRIVGFAGNTYNWKPLLMHLQGEAAEWPKIKESFSMLILELDGRVSIYDEDGRICERPAPCAIGTGRAFAIGAMDAGLDSEQAVHIACNRDTLSGGVVLTLALPLNDENVSTRLCTTADYP